jgi:ComF family protein
MGWPGIFCGPCWESVELAPGPVVLRSADPCGLLLSPFIYGGPLAEAIIRFKHGGLPALGARLAGLALSLLDAPAVDLVVPVPLHPRRLASRGFNQASVIAGRAARSWEAGLVRRALVRIRDTPSQGGLTALARRRNVRGAFALRRGQARLAGSRVALVDDVWTTGATARACARVLLRAGARSVHVLALARVE